MAQNLRIAQSAGRYTVLDEDGAVLTSHSGRAAAVSAAIAHLHAGMGGEVIVLTESGEISSRVPVVGAQVARAPEPTPTRTNSARSPDPPQPRPGDAASISELRRAPQRSEPQNTMPVSAIAPSKAKGASELIADTAGEAAKTIDQALGLKDPKTLLPKDVSDIKIDNLLPEKVANSPTVTLLNKHLSVAAAWIAFVGLVLGTGTVSAVVQAASRAASGGTTVGDYASTGAIFFAASALCISVAAAVWAVLAGRMKGYGAVAAWVIGTVIVSGMLSAAGLAAPSQEQIITALDNGSGTPPGWVMSVLGEFLTFYGLFTYACGLGVGAVLGHLAYRIEQAEVASGRR